MDIYISVQDTVHLSYVSTQLGMVKFQTSLLAKLAVVALFFLITPLLSTSMRSSYIYLLFNLIVIALGVESGFLSAFFKLPDDNKPVVFAAASESPSNMDTGTSSFLDRGPRSDDDGSCKTVEKPVSLVEKPPSKPTLSFVGGGDVEEEEDGEEEGAEEEEEEEVEALRQELFVKAETFIGNFYDQLKMQREESWKKIHGGGPLRCMRASDLSRPL